MFSCTFLAMLNMIRCTVNSMNPKQQKGQRLSNKQSRKKPREKTQVRKASGLNQPYDDDTAPSPLIKSTILEVVENQLRDNNPPETRQTLERLIAAGHSRQEALELIGTAVIEEVQVVLSYGRVFDPIHYNALLDNLQ